MVWSSSVGATPRLAATYGQNCQLCHANPTGAGMRNAYVSAYIGPTELSLKPLPAHEQSRRPKARLNDQISVGTDLRLLYLATNNSQTAVDDLDNTFFQMQGDFYVAFEPDPQFLIYLDRGTGSDYEVFALGRVLPWHGYLKGGRFVPDIGWRWDDHNHYTRERLDLDFPGVTQTGIELGLSPGAFVFTSGIYNGNGGGPFDNNSQKMFVAKLLHRQRIGPVNTAIGASARWNHGSESTERLWGIQAQAGWDKFAYIGDFFGQRNEPFEGAPGLALHAGGHSRTWSWIMSQELDYRPVQGWDVYFGYDFFDPDLDHENGTQYQLSLGSRIYLRHFLKLEPIIRYERETSAITTIEDKRLEILIHAFYREQRPP
jgi:hypothetical protein